MFTLWFICFVLCRHWDLSLSCQHHMVLPHACFVYDAIYHSSLDHVIITAGYDKLIYIWTVHSTESRYGQVYNYRILTIAIIVFFSVYTNYLVTMVTLIHYVLVEKVGVTFCCTILSYSNYE